MGTETTPNSDTGSIFLEEPIGGTNEFGGEDYQPYEAPTPESRGDVLIDDVVEPEEPIEDTELEPVEEQEEDAEHEEPEEVEEESESDTDSATDSDDDSDSDDPDDEGDDDEGKPKKPIPNKVPRKRLNKEVERRKAAEARIRELEAAQANNQPAPSKDNQATIDPKVDPKRFKEMQDAMLDGETDKAMEIFAELQSATVSQVLELSDARLDEQLAIREQNRELAQASESVRASFPELDNTSDDFDEQMVQDVVATRDFYMNQRKLSPGEALKRAAKEVANDYGVEDRAKPEPKPKPKVRKTDVKRKLAAAEKEKGKLGGQSAGNKTELPDIGKLSDEQFAKLDPRVKAKLRGDIL